VNVQPICEKMPVCSRDLLGQETKPDDPAYNSLEESDREIERVKREEALRPEAVIFFSMNDYASLNFSKRIPFGGLLIGVPTGISLLWLRNF